MGIGRRLKEARTAKGLTQEELAKLVNVTKGAIANYENEVSHPKEPVMYALISALQIEPNFLFQDVVEIKNAPSTEDGALTDLYLQLNNEGRAKLMDYARDLVASGRYDKA